MKEGTVSATRPHSIPTKNATTVLMASRNEIPIPSAVKRMDVETIVFVEGNATRLMKL